MPCCNVSAIFFKIPSHQFFFIFWPYIWSFKFWRIIAPITIILLKIFLRWSSLTFPFFKRGAFIFMFILIYFFFSMEWTLGQSTWRHPLCLRDLTDYLNWGVKRGSSPLHSTPNQTIEENSEHSLPNFWKTERQVILTVIFLVDEEKRQQRPGKFWGVCCWHGTETRQKRLCPRLWCSGRRLLLRWRRGTKGEHGDPWEMLHGDVHLQ